MSPENRTRSGLGPLPQRTRLLTGGAVASLALVMLGLSSPALATGQSPQAPAGVRLAAAPGDDKCETYVYYDEASFMVEGRGDKCKGETGPTGPAGPSDCVDIDSYAPNGAEEFSALLDEEGQYHVGRRETGEDYEWQDITDNGGFPTDPCSVSITARGNDAYAKVLTSSGDVYETHGDVNGQNFVWDEEWDLLVNQPALAVKSFKSEKALAGVARNTT